MASQPTESSFSESSFSSFGDSLTVGVVVLAGLTVVQRLVGFGRSLLLTRMLDPVQVGQWDLAFGFLTLAPPLIVLGIPGSLGRYYDYFRVRGQLRPLLNVTMAVCVVGALASAILVVAFRETLAEIVFGVRTWQNLTPLLALSLAAIIVGNTAISVILAARLYRAASVFHFAHGLAFALISVGLALTWQPTVNSVVVGYACASALVCFLAWPLLRRLWRRATDVAPVSSESGIWRRLAAFAASIWVTNLLMNVFELADRLLLVHASPVSPTEALAHVGAYHASRVLPLVLVGFSVLLGTALTPALSRHWEEGRRDEAVALLNLFLKVLLGVAHIGAVCILLVAPILFGVVWAGKFPLGPAFVPLMAAFGVWFGAIPVAQNYLWCCERAWLVTAALVAGVVVNVALSLALIPWLGVYGVAVSTSVSNLLTLVVIFALSARLGMRWDRGVWILALLPMTLWLGPWLAGAAAAVLLERTLRSALILSKDERDWLRFGLRGVVGKVVAVRG